MDRPVLNPSAVSSGQSGRQQQRRVDKPEALRRCSSTGGICYPPSARGSGTSSRRSGPTAPSPAVGVGAGAVLVRGCAYVGKLGLELVSMNVVIVVGSRTSGPPAATARRTGVSDPGRTGRDGAGGAVGPAGRGPWHVPTGHVSLLLSSLLLLLLLLCLKQKQQ